MENLLLKKSVPFFVFPDRRENEENAAEEIETDDNAGDDQRDGKRGVTVHAAAFQNRNHEHVGRASSGEAPQYCRP